MKVDLPARLLYFPYMRVPNNEWFTQVLLYWDQVGTITTERFAIKPGELDPFTQGLIESGLVQPVVPRSIIRDMDQFTEGFLSFVDSRVAAASPKLPSVPITFPVYMEKIGYLLSQELRVRGLARRSTHERLEVDEHTARYLMAYLAATIGAMHEPRYAPATDDESFLEALATPIGPENSAHLRNAARQAVLTGVLPAPDESISVKQLVKFKDKYQHQLTRFRRLVEEESISIAEIAAEGPRQAKMELVSARLSDERDEMASRMQVFGFKKVNAGTLCTAVASLVAAGTALVAAPPVAVAGVSLLGFAGTVLQARQPKTSGVEPRREIAYAALVAKELQAE